MIPFSTQITLHLPDDRLVKVEIECALAKGNYKDGQQPDDYTIVEKLVYAHIIDQSEEDKLAGVDHDITNLILNNDDLFFDMQEKVIANFSP